MSLPSVYGPCYVPDGRAAAFISAHYSGRGGQTWQRTAKVLFADGHIESVDPEALRAPKTPPHLICELCWKSHGFVDHLPQRWQPLQETLYAYLVRGYEASPPFEERNVQWWPS